MSARGVATGRDWLDAFERTRRIYARLRAEGASIGDQAGGLSAVIEVGELAIASRTLGREHCEAISQAMGDAVRQIGTLCGVTITPEMVAAPPRPARVASRSRTRQRK